MNTQRPGACGHCRHGTARLSTVRRDARRRRTLLVGEQVAAAVHGTDGQHHAGQLGLAPQADDHVDAARAAGAAPPPSTRSSSPNSLRPTALPPLPAASGRSGVRWPTARWRCPTARPASSPGRAVPTARWRRRRACGRLSHGQTARQRQQHAGQFARILRAGQAGVGAALQATQAVIQRKRLAGHDDAQRRRAMQPGDQGVAISPRASTSSTTASWTPLFNKPNSSREVEQPRAEMPACSSAETAAVRACSSGDIISMRS